jgi:hypothetical protein
VRAGARSRCLQQLPERASLAPFGGASSLLIRNPPFWFCPPSLFSALAHFASMCDVRACVPVCLCGCYLPACILGSSSGGATGYDPEAAEEDDPPDGEYDEAEPGSVEQGGGVTGGTTGTAEVAVTDVPLHGSGVASAAAGESSGGASEGAVDIEFGGVEEDAPLGRRRIRCGRGLVLTLIILIITAAFSGGVTALIIVLNQDESGEGAQGGGG